MCEVLSAADSLWVSKALREVLEISRDREYRRFQDSYTVSRATVMRNTKQREEQPRPRPAGRYAVACRELLQADGISESCADRITCLLALHAAIVTTSIANPRPGNVRDGHDARGEAMQIAWTTAFGPAAAFQDMTPAMGPLGMAFVCHGRSLHRTRDSADRERWGPFPADVSAHGTFWCTQEARTLLDWLAGVRLPKRGWFAVRSAMRTNQHLRADTGPSDSGNLPLADPSTYSSAYPWRPWVTELDYAVYQVARTLGKCLGEIRAFFPNDQAAAIAVLKRIIVVDPRGSSG